MKIDNETQSALSDLLDTVRDKIIEQNGQVLEWYVHDDTDAEQIVIGFYVYKEGEEPPRKDKVQVVINDDNYGFKGRLP
jgi:formamidopyrimidine-DNA glycosylase